MTDETPGDAAVAVAEKAVPVLRDCGLTDEQILDGVLEAPDSATDSVTAIAHQCEVLHGEDVDTDGRVPTRVLQSVLSGSVRGIVLDNAYHHKRNLEFQLDNALGEFGYGFEFRSVGADEWIEPEDDHHPRAFKLVVTDDGSDVATNGFRYPPYDGFGHVTDDFRALGTALNETVLETAGFQLRMLDEGSEMQKWVLFDEDTLQTLESNYGPKLEVFGEELVRRGPAFQYGWDGIDPSVARDHEDAYGVPEPEDTFKLEEAFNVVGSAAGGHSDGSVASMATALIDRLRRWVG